MPSTDDLMLPPYIRSALRATRAFHDFLVEAAFPISDLPAPLAGSFDDKHLVDIYVRLGRREGFASWLYGAIRTVHTGKQFDAFVRKLPRSVRVPRLRALLSGTVSLSGMRDQVASLIASLAKRSGANLAADLDSIVADGLYGEVIVKPVDIVELGIPDETFADLLLAGKGGEVGDRYRALALAVLTNVARRNGHSTAAARMSDVSLSLFREGIGVLLDCGEGTLAWRLVQDLEALGRDCKVGGLRALYRARRVSGPAARFIHSEYRPRQRQAAINEGIDRDYKKLPARTLASMINFALQSEQTNTGIAIAEYALAVAPSGPLDDQRLLGGAIAEALIAQGEFERAEAMFDFQPSLGGLTDALYAFYADRRGAAVPSNNLLVTPKGRLNTYFINRRLPDLRAALPNLVASHPDLFGKNPQNYLLLANSSKGTPYYLHYVNLFLSAYRSGAIKLTHGAAAPGMNVLAQLVWEPPRRSLFSEAKDGTTKVTVLMAAKNAAATLAYSLTSIVNQTHQNWELLLCDDGSADQTLHIAERFARCDDRIRIFRSAASQGPYNIRNHLLTAATGTYVTTQDADDVSAPSRLEQQVELLDGQKDVLGVVGRWVRVEEDGTFVFFRDGFALRQSTVSTMYRREVLEDFGPFDSVRFGADSEYIERVRALEGDGAIAQMAKPLLFGLWSNQSLTRSSGSEVDEVGYRAPMRRAYAELRMRERLQGDWRGDSTRYPNYIAPTDIVEVN